jgi:hypothetical protein
MHVRADRIVAVIDNAAGGAFRHAGGGELRQDRRGHRLWQWPEGQAAVGSPTSDPPSGVRRDDDLGALVFSVLACPQVGVDLFPNVGSIVVTVIYQCRSGTMGQGSRPIEEDQRSRHQITLHEPESVTQVVISSFEVSAIRHPDVRDRIE